MPGMLSWTLGLTLVSTRSRSKAARPCLDSRSARVAGRAGPRMVKILQRAPRSRFIAPRRPTIDLEIRGQDTVLVDVLHDGDHAAQVVFTGTLRIDVAQCRHQDPPAALARARELLERATDAPVRATPSGLIVSPADETQLAEVIESLERCLGTYSPSV